MDISNRSKALLNRIKRNQKRKEIGRSAIKAGMDVTFWAPKLGQHIIDIIPFKMGSNSPLDDIGQPLTPEGEDDYVLDYWVHRNIGPGEDQTIVCLAKTYREKCPICEHAQELIRKGDQDTADLLKPKRRTIYNVYVWDSAEEQNKGVQIWEVAYFYMVLQCIFASDLLFSNVVHLSLFAQPFHCF